MSHQGFLLIILVPGLVNKQFAIEHGPFIVDDLPIKNGILHSYVKLPEGKMYYLWNIYAGDIDDWDSKHNRYINPIEIGVLPSSFWEANLTFDNKNQGCIQIYKKKQDPIKYPNDISIVVLKIPFFHKTKKNQLWTFTYIPII